MEENRNPDEERSDSPTAEIQKDMPGVEPMLSGSGEPAETYFRVTQLSMFYRYLFISVLTLVGAGFLFFIVPSTISTKDYPLMVILAFWVLALLRYWVYLLGMPHRILCRGQESLYFFSLLRRREILLKEVVAIKSSPIYPSYIRFITSKKKTIPMINHVTGLHELIDRIKEVNPELVTKGC